jgi:hypothetical protein
MMKVLVCGQRDFYDLETLTIVMDGLHKEYKFTTLIHGAAKGADSLAANWAKLNHIEIEAYPADWKKYGKGGGPVRNKQMLEVGKPNLVVAFFVYGEAEKSKGTKDMVQKAKNAGIETYAYFGKKI